MSGTKGLLAIDVDGTLLTDHGHITAEVYDALRRAVDAGWEVAIASGRTYYAVKDIAVQLPFIRYAVLSNGASIMDLPREAVVHMETLPRVIVRKAVDVMRSLGAIPALYDTNQFDQRVYYDTLDGACEFFEWYVTTDKRCHRTDDVLALDIDVLQIGTIARKDIIFAVREALSNDPPVVMALPFESEVFGGKNHEFWFLQIVGENATKHAALRRLSVDLGIPSGRLVAVGDNYNDAEMISRADVGAAMGNAPDEIKRLAKIVVGSNNHSGLSDVVEKVLFSGEFFPQSD
jgi:Cof subfamily protein (haloacid dehalogenase superfamily)